MKILIENTSTIVTIVQNGVEIPARLWQGSTDSGIYVQLLIVRVATDGDADQQQFLQELDEVSPSSSLPSAFPLRMIM